MDNNFNNNVVDNNNEVITEKRKSNKGMIVLIIILILALCASGGYIVYSTINNNDKVKELNSKITELENNNTRNNEGKKESTPDNNEPLNNDNPAPIIDNKPKALDLSKCLNCNDINQINIVMETNLVKYSYSGNTFNYVYTAPSTETGIGGVPIASSERKIYTITFDSNILDVAEGNITGQDSMETYFIFLLEDGSIRGINVEAAYQKSDLKPKKIFDYNDIVRLETISIRENKYVSEIDGILATVIAVKSDGTFYLLEGEPIMDLFREIPAGISDVR